jgi:hypothetical protein
MRSGIHLAVRHQQADFLVCTVCSDSEPGVDGWDARGVQRCSGEIGVHAFWKLPNRLIVPSGSFASPISNGALSSGNGFVVIGQGEHPINSEVTITTPRVEAIEFRAGGKRPSDGAQISECAGIERGPGGTKSAQARLARPVRGSELWPTLGLPSCEDFIWRPSERSASVKAEPRR